MIDDITKRLAHKVWEIFEKEEIPNTPDGNYQAAEGIVRRILNGSYKADEFINFLSEADYEYLKRIASEAAARSETDSDCD